MVLGNVSSACFSLNFILRFGAEASGAGAADLAGLSFPWLTCSRVKSVPRCASIFGPAPVALGRDDTADQTIEKIAVMADEQHGAGIVADHVLEHVQRFH